MHICRTALALAIGLGAASAQAALSPVLRYEFPASYDGTVNAVIDQSGAGNNAIVNQGHPLALSPVAPPTAPPGKQSVDFNTTFGNINTNAIDLVSSSAVATAGGFTYDLWFNPTGFNGGSGIRKIMDFAGTEFIAYDTVSGPGRVTVNVGGNVSYTGAGINDSGWNHVVLEFDTKGAPLVGGSVTGVASVTINGVQRSLGNRTLTNFGDSLNRPLSIGRHPTANGEHFRGLVYDPTVYLGVSNTSNLVGHWKLDEMVNPSGGTTAVDSSGNGNDGVYQPLGAGPVVGVPGAPGFGTAADFSPGNNINLGQPAEFLRQNDFTIAAWIKPESFGGVQRIFSQQPGLGGGYGFGITGDELRFTTYGILDYDTSLVNLVLNEFQHVAVVFDDQNDATFYVNGVPVQTILGTSGANLLMSDFFIGSGGTIEAFNGVIDDVQYFAGALTPAEIRALLTPSSAVPEPASALLLLGAAAMGFRRSRRA